MRRAAVLVVLSSLLLGACSPPKQDENAVRRYLGRSDDRPRSFVYRALSADAAFVVEGKILDDLRYEMRLSSDGRPLVDEITSDDALAVRLLDKSLAAKLSNVLGHPSVDEALRAGKWVVDPSGAPPLVRADTTVGGETTGDPMRDARESFLYATRSLGEAAQIKKFDLEDITYRPLFDPWRYPRRGEVRYDYVRPALPKSAGTGAAGQNEGVTPAQFRKLSIFIRHGRVEQSCEFVDVEGHEDFVALRERGLKSNPYLRDLLHRVQTGQTAVPIKQRVAIVDVMYPADISVRVPTGAVVGKLDVFTSALLQAVTAGLLRPARDERLTGCRRPNARTI
jgi:hypothetical protein